MPTPAEKGTATRTRLKWDTATRPWTFTAAVQEAEANADTGLSWDDYVLIEFISGAGADISAIIDELPSEKKKRLIRLIMRRRGVKLYDESKEVKEIQTKIDDIKLIVKEVKVTMEMNHV
tara:strand:+ start:3624 stop:3983 length:360 start_codon:yes stop_codon:yes gene_type:complete